MLSKYLNDLCGLISTPYENLNISQKITSSFDSFILEEIYLRKLFDFKWRKKLNSSFNNFKFHYNYKILEEDSQFIKLKLNLTISFIIQSFHSEIPSACVTEYIVIFERFDNSFKIQFLIENEDDLFLYNDILNTKLSEITNLIFSKHRSLYAQKLSSIESFYENYMASSFFNSNYAPRKSNFNIDAACAYAETYALNPNPNYKSFDKIGGDCTNFMSQILYAGGVKQTKTWRPYTNPWIRVEELYIYLTTQNLATKIPYNGLHRGCLIQFYTPQKGRFFHNGFITYELPNKDYLYCCHSYNKLNYPLSQIYPHKYPTLRALKIN